MGAETELPRVTSHCSKKNMGLENLHESQFPAGLRVLVVDDDRICLLILDGLLRQCLYKVTTCERAIDALQILREHKDGFDVVISDVHMPDMDGFKLLELVGLEMDLPVIMMSANGETSAVMKGIKHGACDYLLKPVRIEELKNIWQHVVRRKKKDLDNSDDRPRPSDNLANDEFDGATKNTKKRKDAQEEEEDIELENEDPATSKKPRVVWSVDLHQNFVNAVNQLGIDKAVPKRILELMDVRGLTRENVASHLQKYRLYLKRISGVAHQPTGGLTSGYFGCADGRFLPTAGSGFEALVLSLQAGLVDRVGTNNSDPYFFGQVGPIYGSAGGHPYGSPLLNTAGILNPAISSGLDFKHLGRGIGQLVPSGQSEKGSGGLSGALPTSLPLSPRANVGHIRSHDNHFQDDRSKNSLLNQVLQQETRPQIATGLLSERPINTQQSPPKINSGSNVLNSICRPSPESANLNNSSFEPLNGLASFRRAKYTSAPQVGATDYILTSNMPSRSVAHANELGIVVSGKGGIIGNTSDNRNSGLHSLLSDNVSGQGVLRLGAGFQSWPGVGLNQDVSSKSGVSLVGSNFIQGPPATAQESTKMGGTQRWIPKFHMDLVEDADMKPLVITCMAPSIERGLGVSDKLKTAPLDLLLGSKKGSGGTVSESDDLLTCYIKQQQQELMGLNAGDATTENYTPGNVYMK